jgi:hypothetical protein
VNAETILRDTLRSARARRALDAGLAGLPWLVAATTLAWRFGSGVLALATLVVAGAATAAFAWHRARGIDSRWLVRELDAHRPDMEDSADLLYAPTASMTPLERLQRVRLAQRLETAPMPDLRPRWSVAAIGIGAAAATVSIAAVLLMPERPSSAVDHPKRGVTAAPTTAAETRLRQQQLRLVPPVYTGLPAREAATLDAKAPLGTELQWTLRFSPQPRAADLVFHDGRRVAMERDGDDWRARDVLAKSALYRIVLDEAPPLQPATLHRLDATDHRSCACSSPSAA